MITVGEFLGMLDACDHFIVIYDENVIGDDSDNYGDLLWASDTDTQIPRDVENLDVYSFDLEEKILRIWAEGEGIANKYRYSGWND